MRVIEGELPFLEEKEHKIALVGAGGKTTLLYALAGEYAKRGVRVLVTTTTHIYRPEEKFWAKSQEEVKKLWENGLYAVVGQETENGKLKALSREEWQEYTQMAEVILIEADGAKGRPCKVPAAFEPVIPDDCDIVIGVMGMDAFGQPVKKVCFRVEEAETHFQLNPEELLTEERMVEILASDKGSRKNVGEREYYVVLNKCDDEERIRRGRKILRLLEKKGVRHGVLTGFSHENIMRRESTGGWKES